MRHVLSRPSRVIPTVNTAVDKVKEQLDILLQGCQDNTGAVVSGRGSVDRSHGLNHTVNNEFR